MNTKIESCGNFTLGTSARISDPCYDSNTWCAGTLHKVLPGKWEAFIERDSETDRIGHLWARHSSHATLKREDINLRTDIDVGVDAGLAGIYDLDYFNQYHKPKKDDQEDPEHYTWYRTNIIRFGKKDYKVIDDKCVISCTGWGDGSYICNIAKDDQDNIVGIHLDYLMDYEEEDEEYEE